MAGVDRIPDEILRNILSRLPPKPMGRSRCVSTHWNRLISDPSFMISRSSRLFLTRDGSHPYHHMSINILDGSNGSVKNLDFSMFKDLPTIQNWDDRFVKIVGTFSGIILLAVKDLTTLDQYSGSYYEQHMILYNPFTGEHEIIKDPYSPLRGGVHAYGFGYGATPNELKLVRFRKFNSRLEKSWDTCEILNLRTRSWSRPALISPDGYFKDYVGTFLKGYLYWMISSKIMSLNVDKMVISYIHQPESAMDKQSYLGTCHGQLWMITNTDEKTLNFDVWVMNEQGVGNSWSKAWSLAVGLQPPKYFSLSDNMKITEEGRIIISITVDDEDDDDDDDDDDGYMYIYDTSKHSHKLLKCPAKEEAEWGIKYKESLISPMNLCRV